MKQKHFMDALCFKVGATGKRERERMADNVNFQYSGGCVLV
jgi:hypothetical protein